MTNREAPLLEHAVKQISCGNPNAANAINLALGVYHPFLLAYAYRDCCFGLKNKDCVVHSASNQFEKRNSSIIVLSIVGAYPTQHPHKCYISMVSPFNLLHDLP